MKGKEAKGPYIQPFIDPEPAQGFMGRKAETDFGPASKPTIRNLPQHYQYVSRAVCGRQEWTQNADSRRQM